MSVGGKHTHTDTHRHTHTHIAKVDKREGKETEQL